MTPQADHVPTPLQHGLRRSGPQALNGPSIVDDVHGGISRTRVRGIARPRSAGELEAVVAGCVERGGSLTAAGGRHAMARQAFGEDALLVDTRAMNRVLGLDRDRRTIEVESGIDWPTLVHEIRGRDVPGEAPLAIVQKQTGADLMTLGGSISANAHGRGLSLPPIGAQVESMGIVDPSGRLVRCSRSENRDLFQHVIGHVNALRGVDLAQTLLHFNVAIFSLELTLYQ